MGTEAYGDSLYFFAPLCCEPKIFLKQKVIKKLKRPLQLLWEEWVVWGQVRKQGNELERPDSRLGKRYQWLRCASGLFAPGSSFSEVFPSIWLHIWVSKLLEAICRVSFNNQRKALGSFLPLKPIINSFPEYSKLSVTPEVLYDSLGPVHCPLGSVTRGLFLPPHRQGLSKLCLEP